MKFEKKHLIDLPLCYAASMVKVDGRDCFLLAPDAPGPCYSFDIETLEPQQVWEEPGGTMNMVALPWRENAFIAVQKFNPVFKAANAEVVLLEKTGLQWQARTLFKLPYIHRMDIVQRDDKYYIICCTLCRHKDFEQDWSTPGQIMVGELDQSMNDQIQLEVIADGMFKNHGYWHVEKGSYSCSLTACEQGVFEVLPPEANSKAWEVNQIIDWPVSDIAALDIDGDGIDELAVIEPFHGNNFRIYKKKAKTHAGQQMAKAAAECADQKDDSGYEVIYEYPGELEFVHVVWGGTIRGMPVFIGGNRALDRELFCIRLNEGRFETEIIEYGAGPSNIAVLNSKDHDMILVANREGGEGALYLVK